MKRLIIALILVVSFFSLSAQGRKGISLDYFTSRVVHYDLIYREHPSLLSFWEKETYSILELDGILERGDFYDFQQGRNRQGLCLNTAAVLELKDWYFYGKFYFSSGKVKDVAENLQLHSHENGNPFYFFCQQPGDWNEQRYHLEGAFSKSVFKDKIYLGAAIEYYGDLSFRYVDTRNEEYDFTFRLIPSLTWKINRLFALDLSYSFSREKAQPSFRNKYPENATDDRFNKYLNAGLGTYVKNVSTSNETVGYGHKVNLGLNYLGKKHRVDLRYGFMADGSTVSTLYNSTFNEVEPRIGSYSAFRHDVVLNHTCNTTLLTSDTYLDLDYLQGNARLYDDNGALPVHYTSQRMNCTLGTRLEFRKSYVSDCSFRIDLDKVHDTDLKYGQEMTYGRLRPAAGCNFDFSFTDGKYHFLLGCDTGFRFCLWKDHQVRGAEGNLFTERIAAPRYRYETTDLAQTSLSLGFAHLIRKGGFKYLITGDWYKPVRQQSSMLSLSLNLIYLF